VLSSVEPPNPLAMTRATCRMPCKLWFFLLKNEKKRAFELVSRLQRRGIARAGAARRCSAPVTTSRDQPPYSRTFVRPNVPGIISINQGAGVYRVH